MNTSIFDIEAPAGLNPNQLCAVSHSSLKCFSSQLMWQVLALYGIDNNVVHEDEETGIFTLNLPENTLSKVQETYNLHMKKLCAEMAFKFTSYLINHGLHINR